ncbi:hypothetical protein M8C13_09035 [Crossiella sp. SN42]|uniref:NucA/NucB deoxyribonuclease domain-containing protein n=1 Tax=Crossiella sp. SN42 TaxID=2944808 RepID=UPI00207D3135|nr:hypothetical protein [Crossiella sp. SN42]MCO1575900.1 hypothetical protein [Crossiella sp. SN42]
MAMVAVVGVLGNSPASAEAEATIELGMVPMSQVSTLADEVGRKVSPAVRQPGQKPTRVPKSAEELDEIRRPGTQFAPVSSRIANRPPVPGSAAFSPVDDPITRAECQKFYENTEPPPDQWHKNRFNLCYGAILQARKIDQNGAVLAAIQAKAVFMISMNKNARSAVVSVELFDWFNVGGLFPTSQKITFGTGCWDPEVGGPECTPDTVSFDDTIANWQNRGIRQKVVEFSGTSAMRPDDPAPNEKRSFYQFVPYFYVQTGRGTETDFVRWPEQNLRCDVARTVVNDKYVRGSDCVFHKDVGILKLDASRPDMAESVNFIRDAFDNIGSTKPGTAGSYVPGKFGTPTSLSRLYYDQALRAANRDHSIETCIANYGRNYTVRPDGKTNDCDEYPFAGTHEGSHLAQFAFPRSFAVRPLLNLHNQMVGSELSTYLAQDHVVEGDRFQVHVYN